MERESVRSGVRRGHWKPCVFAGRGGGQQVYAQAHTHSSSQPLEGGHLHVWLVPSQ